MKSLFIIIPFIGFSSIAFAQTQTNNTSDNANKPISEEIRKFKKESFQKRKNIELGKFKDITQILNETEICLNKAVTKQDFVNCDEAEKDKRAKLKETNSSKTAEIKEERKKFIDKILEKQKN